MVNLPGININKGSASVTLQVPILFIIYVIVYRFMLVRKIRYGLFWAFII